MVSVLEHLWYIQTAVTNCESVLTEPLQYLKKYFTVLFIFYYLQEVTHWGYKQWDGAFGLDRLQCAHSKHFIDTEMVQCYGYLGGIWNLNIQTDEIRLKVLLSVLTILPVHRLILQFIYDSLPSYLKPC